MKKNRFLALALLFFGAAAATVASAAAQEAVKNPDKPANPKAGRVLELKEELRISDAGGQFFFYYPSNLKIGPDGSIYFRDRDELVRLDAQGKFVRNYFRKGQGPGELNFVSGFDCAGDRLLVHSSDPDKLVWFDAQGKMAREVSLIDTTRLDFLFHAGETAYFFKLGTYDRTPKPAPIEAPRLLVAIPDGESRPTELAAFPVRMLLRQGAMLSDSVQAAVVGGRYIFVNHSDLYSIKIFDIKERRLLRAFSRPYKRVPRPKGQRVSAIITSDGTRHEMPGSDILPDISDMFAAGDRLWVRTSTEDPDKGFLIDVFDSGGRYMDMFYLKTAGRLAAVDGDFVFLVERTPQETIEIVKCKIVG